MAARSLEEFVITLQCTDGDVYADRRFLMNFSHTLHNMLRDAKENMPVPVPFPSLVVIEFMRLNAVVGIPFLLKSSYQEIAQFVRWLEENEELDFDWQYYWRAKVAESIEKGTYG